MTDGKSVITEDGKKAWKQPEIVEFIIEEKTEGNGGGGPDFGSEMS